MKKPWTGPACAGALIALAACTEPVARDELVARVDDYTLSVDQVVELLVDEEALAADVNVVRSLADFWVDYVLLAEAVQEDSTFSDLDLEPLVEQSLWQTMMFQLRDSVIQADTFITDGELRALYEAEAPEVEVRARHIMVRYPVQSTPAQRDSVRARLEAVRARIEAGESFETLARQVSQDPASAPLGGDLGYFARGDMVAPFEEAALALQPGEVSGIVETPMGLHVIRVDDRRTPGFEDVAAGFRRQVQVQRVQQADSTYLAMLEERVSPELAEGAAELAREVAGNPGAALSGRAARRAVVEWTGGSVTMGELLTLFRVEAPRLRAQIAQADDETVETFLMDLARRELVVDEALAAGLGAPRERVDSLVADAATQLLGAARTLGLTDLDRAPGEPRELAIARAVEEALADNLSGATQFVPLGLVSFQLRDRASFATYDTGIGEAIVRIAQLRANRQLAPIEGAPSEPDTVGP